MSEVILSLSGENDIAETTDLVRWIERERLDAVEKVEQKTAPPKEGEMGPSLLAILGVVLGAKATVELVKSIHKWIETRKRKVSITIEVEGKTITVDCESPETVSEIIQGLGLEM